MGPKAGRFLSEDPLTFSEGVNFYTYVKNRPTTLTDPLGLQALPVQQCAVVLANGKPADVGLCCRNGQYVLCADESKWPRYSGYAQYCAQVHETFHVTQRQGDPKTSCGECTGQPCTTLSHPPNTAPKRECRAWWITYLCFRNSGERDLEGELWESVSWNIVMGCRGRGFLE